MAQIRYEYRSGASAGDSTSLVIDGETSVDFLQKVEALAKDGRFKGFLPEKPED